MILGQNDPFSTKWTKRHRYFRDPPEPETPEPESPVPLETLEPETLEPTIRKIIIPTLIKILLQTKACC
jgi:hypothetical protein